MSSERNIFRRGNSSWRALFIASFAAVALLATHFLTDWLDPLRARSLDLVAPVYRITDLPARIREWSETSFSSREELLAEMQMLRDQNLILQGRVATMASVVAENSSLRNLLSVSQHTEARLLITELVGTPPSFESHRILIDKGSDHDLYVGQPVVDADGLIGQLLSVGREHSEVLLITDRSHAVPVQSLRSGYRAIAEGTGDYRALRLRHVAVTADIQEGDELVTSGLGERFPGGYPLGLVTSVTRPVDSAFLEVTVEPFANLQTTRHMLLLFTERSSRVIGQPD
jgi:rod shape-determining protein MreC